LAIVTNVGRDAVDALAAQDERRTKRTAKSCGPDIPTLISSWRRCFASRQWRRQQSPVSGASTKETVKTIVQGKPDVPAHLWRRHSCAFYFCTRGYGCRLGTRLSLRPRFFGRV